MTQTASVTGDRDETEEALLYLKRRCEVAQQTTRSVRLEIWKATHGNHKELRRADMPVSQWKGKHPPVCVWWSLEWERTVLGSQENTCLPETRCHNLGMPNMGRAQGKAAAIAPGMLWDPQPTAAELPKCLPERISESSAPRLTFTGIWGKTVPIFGKWTEWERRSRHSCLLYPSREGTPLGYSILCCEQYPIPPQRKSFLDIVQVRDGERMTHNLVVAVLHPLTTSFGLQGWSPQQQGRCLQK